MYRTTDTGKTWIRTLPYSSNGLWFLNNGKGICYANNYIHTSSTGSNWTPMFNLPIASPTYDYFTIYFTDINNGWMCAKDKIYKTTDGGNTWTTQTRPHHLTDIHFLNDQDGFYSTQNEIFKTSNGGNSWTRICKVGGYYIIAEIFFIDENNGWACGTDGLFLRLKS